MPADAVEGATFPINLRFHVEDQLITGYTHLLRVVPLAEAMAQALDTLYAALRDVGVGCESDDALALAKRVEGIIQRYAGDPEKSLTSLRRAIGELSALTQRLELAAGGGPECRAIHRRLFELAGRLLAKTDAVPPDLLVEQIRDLADRIQEPAGRLARQRLSQSQV